MTAIQTHSPRTQLTDDCVSSLCIHPIIVISFNSNLCATSLPERDHYVL